MARRQNRTAHNKTAQAANILQTFLEERKQAHEGVTDRIGEQPPEPWVLGAEEFLRNFPLLLNGVRLEFGTNEEFRALEPRLSKGFAMTKEQVEQGNEETAFRYALFLCRLLDPFTTQSKYGYVKSNYGNTYPYLIRPCGCPVPWDKQAKEYEAPGSWSKIGKKY